MSAVLTRVAMPTDDPIALAQNIRVLRSASAQIDSQRQLLARQGEHAMAEWIGEGSEAFVAAYDTTQQLFHKIGHTQSAIAHALTDYEQEILRAQAVSRKATSHIEAAINDYARNAHAAINSLESGVTNAVEKIEHAITNAIDAVVHDLSWLWGAKDTGLSIINRLNGWSMPGLAVSMDVWDVASGLPFVPSQAEVLQHIHSYANLAVSSLADGIEEIVHWGAGLLHHGVDALKKVELALAHAYEVAHRWVADAFQRLVDCATRVGRLIWEFVESLPGAVVDYAKGVASVFAFGAGVVNWVIHHPTETARWMASAPEILEGLAVAAANRAIFGRVGPRMENSYWISAEAEKDFIRKEAYRKSLEAYAAMAGGSYAGKNPPKGWTRQTISGPDGASLDVFENPKTHQVVVSFRGSEPADGRDWKNDILNAANIKTSQGTWAIEQAKQLARDHPGITFTGHSLGGSLASIASIATGRPAVTFNAAGIGEANYHAAVAAHGGVASESQITNLHTKHDVVTTLQDTVGLRPAAGIQIEVESTTTNPIDAHGMDAFDWKRYE